MRDLSSPLAASGKFHPADTNKDGKVSSAERKAYKKFKMHSLKSMKGFGQGSKTPSVDTKKKNPNWPPPSSAVGH